MAPNDQRDIPEDMASHSVYKVEGRRKKEGMFGMMALVFPSNCCIRWARTVLEMAEHLPNEGEQ